MAAAARRSSGRDDPVLGVACLWRIERSRGSGSSSRVAPISAVSRLDEGHARFQLSASGRSVEALDLDPDGHEEGDHRDEWRGTELARRGPQVVAEKTPVVPAEFVFIALVVGMVTKAWRGVLATFVVLCALYQPGC